MADGCPVHPHGIAAHVFDYKAGQYFFERDQFRADRGAEAKCVCNLTIVHSASVFQLIAITPAKAPTVTRVIYDTGYHGGNCSEQYAMI